jgi:putative transposase
MHRLGRIPPAEAEAQYYSEHVTDQPAGSQNPEGARNSGCFMASADMILTSCVVSHLVVRSYALPTQIHAGVSTNYSLWKIPVKCRCAIREPFKPRKDRAFRAFTCGFVSQSTMKRAQNHRKFPIPSRRTKSLATVGFPFGTGLEQVLNKRPFTPIRRYSVVRYAGAPRRPRSGSYGNWLRPSA